MSALPHLFWINLDRATGRRERMLERLAARGIAHTRIAGVDGDDLAAVRRCIRCDAPTNADAATIASHLTALRVARDEGHEVAVILEDDATFETHDAMPGAWTRLERALPLRFGAVALAIMQAPVELDRLFRRKGKIVRLGRIGYWSLGAYAVDRAGMDSLLGRFDHGDAFDVHAFAGRHEAYDVVMRGLHHDRTIDGPWIARVPLFSLEGDDSYIHPAHLDRHRPALAFINEHHRALVDGSYRAQFGPRTWIDRFMRRNVTTHHR